MCRNIVSSCVRSHKRDQWTSAVVRRGDVAALKPMLALFPNRSGSRPAGPGPQQGRDLGQRVLSAAGAASRSEPGTCYRQQQQQQQQRRRRRRGFPAGRSAGMAANGIAKHRFEMFINGMEEAQINRKLPKELLLRIFSYLDVVSLCRCAQVSKFWNVLALDGSNWQKIDLFNFQRDVEGRVVENISKRCGGFLRQLSLRGCQGVGDAALRTFAQNCRNIETLSLNGCTKITDNTCGSLGKFCSKLRHLDLTSCTVITNYSLKALSEGCKNLEHLNVSWCDQVTEDGITAMVRECPNLKALRQVPPGKTRHGHFLFGSACGLYPWCGKLHASVRRFKNHQIEP
uniref:F-box and leucine-rich repeat protein 2 n=1 Tax=Eptatretus burgeri TaxID=7764 RepID=A0A8C4QAY7_EPTBU